MDKIQELHHDKVSCLSGIIKTDVLARDHATITEDLMGRFAEWVGKHYRKIEGDDEGFVWKEQLLGRYYTTSELITMFKETL